MNVAIIQARVGSTRLPNKVFLELAGKPLIWHVCNRLKKSTRIDKIVLATTVSKADYALAEWAIENEISLFRGSEDDVLSRYYHAAFEAKADVITRITADDPFKDAHVIDKVVDLLTKNKLDFAFNNYPPSFPEGLDTEVFTFQALEKAYLNSVDPFEREHVTQYFYRNREMFKMENLSYGENISHLRWTIDREEDYRMAKRVYDNLYTENKMFWMEDILEFLKRNPEVIDINKDVERSTMYLKN